MLQLLNNLWTYELLLICVLKYELQPITVSDQEVVEMILFPVVNEACRVLEEGVVVRASDLDVASVLGMSFPSYRWVLTCKPWSLSVPLVWLLSSYLIGYKISFCNALALPFHYPLVMQFQYILIFILLQYLFIFQHILISIVNLFEHMHIWLFGYNIRMRIETGMKCMLQR